METTKSWSTRSHQFSYAVSLDHDGDCTWCSTRSHVLSLWSMVYQVLSVWSVSLEHGVPGLMCCQSGAWCTKSHVLSVWIMVYQVSCAVSLEHGVPGLMCCQSGAWCTRSHVLSVWSMVYQVSCVVSLEHGVPGLMCCQSGSLLTDWHAASVCHSTDPAMEPTLKWNGKVCEWRRGVSDWPVHNMV